MQLFIFLTDHIKKVILSLSEGPPAFDCFLIGAAYYFFGLL
ncbi:hypothetical protein KR50_33230 [Jeotgalibacillus campisalis]|uniref:Uncharacterized protein n=1 Tax=Jeotgalibacillus campisalis TaxID=220754 RepID=A0A0C2QXZ9_9BACL|nr:hypothetical protein KR50_33230 [Jeotgalibacillus campisalis]